MIIGSYGRGNVGDDAFLYAALKLFKGSKLYINSADDSLISKDILDEVDTIPTSGLKDIRQKIKIFISLTHIVYCGGDLWVKLYGDKFPRQSLYKMVILNLASKLFRKKIAYIGCGAGKVTGYSLFLARMSAKLATLVIVRDQATKNLLRLKKIIVLSDLTSTICEVLQTQKKDSSIINVGISLMYYIPVPDKNFQSYINTLARTINRIIDSDSRIRIVLIPMLKSTDEKDDRFACAQLFNLLDDKLIKKVTIMNYESFFDFLKKINQLNVMIGTRLHANILSTLLGVPSIGIAYRPKVSNFFIENNLGRNFIAIDDVQSLDLKFKEIMANYDDTKKHFETVSNKLTFTGQMYAPLIKIFLND